MPKSYITTRGLSSTQDLVLRSLISLLPGRTREDWEYSDDETANVVIVDVESDVGKVLWERYSAQNTKHCVVAVASEGVGINAQYKITKPIRFRNLLDVLDIITSSQRWLTDPGHDTGWQLNEDQGNVASSHYKLLDIVITENLEQKMRVSVGDVDLFVIDPVHKLVYLLSDMQRICEAFTAYEVEILTRPEAAASFENTSLPSVTQSLDSFRWDIGLNAFAGKFLPSIANWRGYQLNCWPNFEDLNHHPSTHPQLAACLSSGPSTVDSVSRTLDLTRYEIIDFLNASFLCGWLVNADQSVEATQEVTVSSGVGRVLGSIRRRFGA